MRKIDTRCLFDKDLNNWLKLENGVCTIGVTDFAQEFMGPVTVITDLPAIGQILPSEAIYALVESSKATTELLLPIGGKVQAINPILLENPALINEDCYAEGWIIQLIEVKPAALNELISAEEYTEAIASFFNK